MLGFERVRNVLNGVNGDEEEEAEEEEEDDDDDREGMRRRVFMWVLIELVRYMVVYIYLWIIPFGFGWNCREEFALC